MDCISYQFVKSDILVVFSVDIVQNQKLNVIRWIRFLAQPYVHSHQGFLS